MNPSSSPSWGARTYLPYTTCSHPRCDIHLLLDLVLGLLRVPGALAPPFGHSPFQWPCSLQYTHWFNPERAADPGWPVLNFERSPCLWYRIGLWRLQAVPSSSAPSSCLHALLHHQVLPFLNVDLHRCLQSRVVGTCVKSNFIC